VRQGAIRAQGHVRASLQVLVEDPRRHHEKAREIAPHQLLDSAERLNVRSTRLRHSFILRADASTFLAAATLLHHARRTLRTAADLHRDASSRRMSAVRTDTSAQIALAAPSHPTGQPATKEQTQQDSSSGARQQQEGANPSPAADPASQIPGRPWSAGLEPSDSLKITRNYLLAHSSMLV
jgi:hypothetical protein